MKKIILVLLIVAAFAAGFLIANSIKNNKTSVGTDSVSINADIASNKRIDFRKGEALVKSFFESYVSGDTKKMDEVAEEGAKYDKLVSSGLPGQLMLYYKYYPYKLEGTDPPKWYPEKFTVSANDTDGTSWCFLVTLDGDKISKIVVDPESPRPEIEPGWEPLTAEDRLAIIKETKYVDYKMEECYWDFDFDASYKGYTRVMVCTPVPVALTNFVRKKDGKWEYVMESTDYFPSVVLTKIGVPLDVQLAVWGVSPETDRESGITESDWENYSDFIKSFNDKH